MCPGENDQNWGPHPSRLEDLPEPASPLEIRDQIMKHLGSSCQLVSPKLSTNSSNGCYAKTIDKVVKISKKSSVDKFHDTSRQYEM